MKTQDVITRFGSKAKIAKALGITKQAVSQWGERVPLGTAALLEKASNGELQLNPMDYAIRRRKYDSDVVGAAPQPLTPNPDSGEQHGA